MASATAAAVLRGRGGGASTDAAPSIRCSFSTAAGGGSVASEAGYSYMGSTAPLSSSSVMPRPRSPSSPPLMGVAGTRFGPVFRALRRSSSLHLRKLAPVYNFEPGIMAGKKSVVEERWRQFFIDPSQWWDHRLDKCKISRLQT